MRTLILISSLLLFTFLSYGQRGFMHPNEQIDFVKVQLKDNIEPYQSAFDQLKSAANEALNMTDHAIEDFYVPGFYDKPEEHRKNSLSLQTDAFNAYSCALAYTLGAGNIYGEKACELLNAWAKTNKKYSDHDGPLVMSYSGTALVIAAQLLYDSKIWKEEDQKLFKQWIINVYSKACNEIRTHHNNWADWGRFGSLLSAVYLEDKSEITENVRLIKSDLFKKVATDGSMPEETRREKNGLWYTYFSLAPMTAACWIVYNATGENLFTLEKNGASIKSALDYLYYYNLHPNEWKWCEGPNTGAANSWPGVLLEAMSGIYGNCKYIDYVKSSRPLMYPTHHFAWAFPTLMPLSLNGYTNMSLCK